MPEELYGAAGGGGGGAAKVSLDGNTSGTLTLISSGTLYLGGGNNITLSQVGNSITISGAANTGATTFQAGVSNIGNTSGVTGTHNNMLVLAGGNNVTLSQSVNGQSMTVTISGANAGGAQTGISAIADAVSSVTVGTVQFQNSNNISFGLNGSTMTASYSQSLQPAQTGISGISASNTLYTSGTVKLTGSNLVTVRSGTGQAVVIDASFSQTVQPAQTGISSVSVSDTVYTSGGISIVGSHAATVKSGAGQQVVIDVPVQTAQTGVSGIAGSAASTVTAGTVVFANSNNMSFGLNGSTMTGSFSQSVQPAQTGISGISASDTVYSSGTVKFTGSNMVTVKSGTGQAVIFDATQSVQTQGSVVINGSSGAISISGSQNVTAVNNASTIILNGPANILNSFSIGGNTGTTNSSAITGGGYVIAGGSNVTLSQSNNTISIHGGAGGGATFSGGISTNGNTSGDTGFATNRLVLIGGNNITLSGSTNAGSMSLTISGPNAGGAQTGISGISASDTVYTSGTVKFTGSNMITVKSGTGQLVIIDATQSVQPAQTGISGIAGSAASTVTQGTVQFANSNGISFGLNGSTMTASYTVPTQSVQTWNVVSASGNTSGTLTSFTTGTVVFAGGNNITLSQSSNTITISAFNQSVQPAQTGISGIAGSAASTVTAGTVVFANSNSMSFGLNGSTMTGSFSVTNTSPPIATAVKGVSSIGSTGTITRFAPEDHQHAGVFSMGVSNIGNTLGNTTVIPGQFVLSGGNNITLSQATAAGNLVTVGFMGPDTFADKYNILSASGNTTGTLTTFSTGTVVIAGGANITLSQSSNTITIVGATIAGQPVNFSAGASSDNLGSVVFSNSNGVSFGLSGSTITASAAGGGGAAIGMTNTGNTSGTTFSSSSGTMYFQGTNNVTVSNSSAAGIQTLWISGPTGGGAGMGTGTNTSGTSGTVGAQLYIYANSNLGLSQSVNGSSASLTIVNTGGGGGGIAAGMTNTGNTAGNQFSSSTGTIFIAGTNNITISASTGAGSVNTIWVSGPTLPVFATANQWSPPGIGYSSFTQIGQSSVAIFPAQAPMYFTATAANLYASIALSTSSNSSHSGVISLDVGIYTKNASTLSMASSGTTQHSWNVTGTTSSGSIVGWRALSVPINVNMTPGDYWIAILSRTATTNANWFTASNMALIAGAAAFSGPLGATNNTNQSVLGAGIWSAQTAALPASIAFSHITATSASTARPIINFYNYTV